MKKEKGASKFSTRTRRRAPWLVLPPMSFFPHHLFGFIVNHSPNLVLTLRKNPTTSISIYYILLLIKSNPILSSIYNTGA